MKSTTVGKINKSDGTTDDTAVISTATGYTESVNIGKSDTLNVSLLAKSPTGTPDIDVWIEQTHIDPKSISSEGDAPSIANGWAVPEGASKLLDITDKTAWHHLAISALSLPWVRLKLIGVGANPADCTVEPHITRGAQD